MKKNTVLLFLLLAGLNNSAQEVLRSKNGAVIAIQSGSELTIQGGITLENGSGLLNNGTLRLKNNSIANGSDWIDNSISGALNGTGKIIFNSANAHNFSGPSNFYAVQINSGGLTLNNNCVISNQLQLTNGKVNTGASYIFISN